MERHVWTLERGCQLMFDGIIKTDTHTHSGKAGPVNVMYGLLISNER